MNYEEGTSLELEQRKRSHALFVCAFCYSGVEWSLDSTSIELDYFYLSLAFEEVSIQ